MSYVSVTRAALDEVSPNEFLGPFLEVIRSEDTTGPITGLALTSVNKFLQYGLIGELVHESSIFNELMGELSQIGQKWLIEFCMD